MSELARPIYTNFDAALEGLADNMREYDQILADNGMVRDEFVVNADDLSPISQEQRLVVTDGLVKFSYPLPLHPEFYGRRVKVTSLFPDQYDIGTSRMNQYGYKDGLSKYYDSRKGKVTDVWLDATTGGWIEFRGRTGRYYSAGPLIVRAAGYVPAFQIEDLTRR